ncbi:hypothetical protein imdm_2195 [gamma proteobacterium IMCC2047]|nr:hypothetical protein imdm_2195 [gamma proteobacterium IMCC2047]
MSMASSNADIRRLTLAVLVLIRSAAWWKLPVSTTAMKV